MKTVRALLHLGLLGGLLVWNAGLTSAQPEEEMMEMSEVDLEAEAPDEPVRLSMDFKDANIKDVLKTFSQQAGINVIANEEIGDKNITLYLEDVTVLDALDQILQAGNLTYELPAGSDIYIVKPKDDGTVPTITRVYQLKYARVSKSILARASAAFNAITPFEAFRGLEEIDNQGGSGGRGGGRGGGLSGGGGLGGGIGGGQSGQQLEDIGIDAIVKKLLTKNGEVVVDGRTNRLVITDVAQNFPRLEAALVALDVRTPQIMVDAEVLETSLSKLKDLGVEWGTGSEGNLFTFNPASRTTRAPWSTLFGEKSSAATSITLGTLNTGDADAVLQALEKDTDTKVLARPKILTLDNESAVIRLTVDQATGFLTTTGQQTATTTATPERTTTGVILSVTPQVNEGNYITLLVEPSVTKVVASVITPPTSIGGTVVDPKTRSTRSVVRVRSGQTLVIGGLIDRTEEKSLQKVPVLSGIPFLGEAFKNSETNNVATELIVFLTPRILEEEPVEQLAAAPMTAIREQELPGNKQEAIEQSLNILERAH